MKPAQEIAAMLPQFTGASKWYKWNSLFPRDLLTDGSVYVAEACEAFWLMDVIASHQLNPRLNGEDFQVWYLVKRILLDAHGKRRRDYWDLTCTDGNDKSPDLVCQEFEYSDFPLNEIKLYAGRNELGGITICLPSER
jgi:hypothetical protein